MHNLNLILPGLLWQDLGDIEYLYSNINTKNFDKLLKSAKVTSHAFSYSTLVYGLLYKDIKTNLAQHFAITLGVSNEYSTFLIAQPTHLRADRDRLLISEPELLQLTEEEAKKIISIINIHFNNELKIFYITATMWLIGVKFTLNESKFYPIIDIIGENIDDYLPSGTNQILFSKVLNEIQMLLFDIRINQERKNEGLLTINSIWMWDKNLGDLKQSPNNIIELLGRNLIYLARSSFELFNFAPDVLNVHDVTYQKPQISSALSIKKTINGDLLDGSTVFIDSLYYPCRYRDSSSWMNTIENLDQQIAKVVNEYMNSGKINNLRLFIPTQYKTIEINLSEFSTFKFWRNNTFLKIIKDYQ